MINIAYVFIVTFSDQIESLPFLLSFSMDVQPAEAQLASLSTRHLAERPVNRVMQWCGEA